MKHVNGRILLRLFQGENDIYMSMVPSHMCRRLLHIYVGSAYIGMSFRGIKYTLSVPAHHMCSKYKQFIQAAFILL